MAEGLAKKRRIRAGHRGVVTKRIMEVDGLLKDKAATAEEGGRVKLSQLKLMLKEKLTTLKQLDGEILDMLEADSEVSAEIETSDEFSQKLYEALVKIKRCEASTSAESSRSTMGEGRGLEEGVTPIHSKTKLPKLVLKPFDGNINKWKTFWDSYTSAIHSDPSLEKVDKFTYLQGLLEKTAKDAVSGLALTSDNYDQAIAILERRFGNKQMIIHRHMEILLGIEGVSSANNLVGLRKLYDKVESNVRSLEALGVKPESYGSLLSSVLVKKLPNEFRLIVTRNVSGDWELQSIMDILSEELEARERSATPLIKDGVRRVDPPTASALVSGTRQVSFSCCYCGGQHFPESCDTVKSAKDRKQVLRTTGRCYGCLRTGHLSRACRSKSQCNKCGARHHRSICEASPGGEGPTSTSETSGPSRNRSETSNPTRGLNPSAPSFGHSSTTCCCGNDHDGVLLQTAQATLFNPAQPNQQMNVSILLDSGSQCSHVTESVSEFLNLKNKGKKMMTLMTFGSRKPVPVTCQRVEVGVEKEGGSPQLLSVFTVPIICEPLSQPSVKEVVRQSDCLKGLRLADEGLEEAFQPDVLLGVDHYWTFITGEYIHMPNGPVAMNTLLGWVLSGPVCHSQLEKETTSLVTHVLRTSMTVEESNRRLERQLHRFWELESVGIVDEERTIYEQFVDMVQLQDGRYEVLLPWKDSSEVIPDNYQLCVRRLNSLLRRLNQNPELLLQYDQVIRNQVNMGILEPVELERGSPGQTPEQGLKHYLPHHAVVKQDNQATKIRVVYDASARSGGPSLNDCLHVGPKFSQKILEILLRFRVHNIAVVADIEKAFLMVAVNPRDRDALRFLWVRDVEKQPSDICHVNKFQSTHPDLVDKLNRSVYVDDVVLGASTVELAHELCSESRRILLEGGFNLRKFLTNHEELQARISMESEARESKQDETYTATMLGKSQIPLSGERKVLGVRWNTATDELVLSAREIASTAQKITPSKRQVVSVVGHFYDPLGILFPVLTPFKVYFQKLCEASVSWDQPLQGDLLKEWNELVSGLSGDCLIRVPRCYQDFKDGFMLDEKLQGQLYGFCDASLKAYAAAVYLVTGEGEERVSRLVYVQKQELLH